VIEVAREHPPTPFFIRGGDRKVSPSYEEGGVEVVFPSFEEGIKGCSYPICAK